MNVLDRMIAPLFPGWAVRRAIARENLAMLGGFVRSSGGQDINDQKARADAARYVGTPNQDVERDRKSDLATARYLMARNGVARGAVNSITGNVIGRGMTPESAIQFRSGPRQGQPSDEENSRVEEVFTRWAKRCDLTGKRSFRFLQRQIYRERWISNDVFIRRHIVRVPRGEVPLRLEIVAGELLADITDGDRIWQGVEFDADRREPILYHFYRSAEDLTIVKVDAKDVIHVFKPHRPGAVRGIAPMAPVATLFEALRRYLNNELTRAGVAAAFLALHKSGGSGIAGLRTSKTTDSQDAWGNKLIQLMDGGVMLLKGGQNDSLESAAPSIQSTAFDPFVRIILRMIATAMGVSYELIARDFTKTNFSSARQANLEDRRQWEPEQEEFIEEFLDVAWDWFVDAARLNGVAPFTSARADWPVNWTPQGWLWVDPQKEITATDIAIQIGLDNPIDAARRVGRDYHENVRKIAAAKAFADDLGVMLGTEPPAPEEPEGEDSEESSEEEAEGAPGPSAAVQAA